MFNLAKNENSKKEFEEKILEHIDSLYNLALRMTQNTHDAEDKKIAKTPIIMLTAKDSDADRVIGKVIGADRYMTKLFEPDQLSDKIKELLKKGSS